MKNLKKLFIAALFVIGANVSGNAQKIAHINVYELLSAMPEMKTANDEVKKAKDKFEKDYQTMVTELQTKAQKYQTEAPTAGDAVNATREAELQQSQDRIMQFQQNAQNELAKKDETLKTPILEKAQKAIHKVARAKGYEYVLDSTVGSGVILADGPNLMEDVKKELAIK